MFKFRFVFLLILVILLAGSLVVQNFGLTFVFSLLITLLALFFVGHERKQHETQTTQSVEDVIGVNKQLIEELEKYKLAQSSWETKTKELERTKLAMTSMTKDVLAERDRVEKERAKDAAILKSVGESMFAVGLNGNLVFINSVAQELVGMREEEALGKFVDQVFVIFDENMKVVPHEQQPVVQTLNTSKPVNQTYFFTGDDGQRKSLNITSTPIKQKDELIGAICIIRDITKEKEVDRMKTEFISLASHQLRTPLSAIKWFSEMLITGDAGQLNPEQKGFAQNISDSTERMIDLVNSLLNISRIESGRIIVDPKPTDLKKLVESIVTELKVKFDEKKQKFVLSVHENLPLLNIDPRLIRQVYLNLLTNSIKYSPDGGEIVVMISRKDNEILSQVSDNGFGIPQSQHSKIFQKFFRADNVTKVETDGTGLGLYLIKTIIDSSKGKIWFQSEEGKGTTFFFTLPQTGMQARTGEVTLD
jgi:PAS domain S-box-containing protein